MRISTKLISRTVISLKHASTDAFSLNQFSKNRAKSPDSFELHCFHQTQEELSDNFGRSSLARSDGESRTYQIYAYICIICKIHYLIIFIFIRFIIQLFSYLRDSLFNYFHACNIHRSTCISNYLICIISSFNLYSLPDSLFNENWRSASA